MGLLLRHPAPERLHLERVLGDLTRARGPGTVGAALLPGGRSGPAHPGGPPAGRHVGDAVSEVSDHPEYSFWLGEAWTTKVLNAIMESPMWAHTAVFLTWDDYGGFYDHVPPPQVDAFGLDPGADARDLPYSKHGHSHELAELVAGSVHRGQLGLPQLSERDRRATPLHDPFDFEQRPRPPDPRPVPRDCQGEVYPNAPPGRNGGGAGPRAPLEPDRDG